VLQVVDEAVVTGGSKLSLKLLQLLTVGLAESLGAMVFVDDCKELFLLLLVNPRTTVPADGGLAIKDHGKRLLRR
jgi:hypothetical protein